MIRPRLKMARQAITQQQRPTQQQSQQPGMRQTPQTSQTAQRPVTNAQQSAVYRPGPTATSPAQTAPAVGIAQMPRPTRISGAPTGVNMSNVGDKLSGWQRGGYTGPVATPANPNDMPKPPTQSDVPVDSRGQDYDPNAGQEEKSTEQMISDLVRQSLEAAQNVDTTEQESLINQRVNDQLSMDLLNARAGAGASGFEASGALMGAEGDIRRAAATDAVEQILGARRDASEEAFNRAMDVAGLDQTEREMAFEEWKAQQQIDALNRWIETQGGEGAGGGDPGAGDINGDGTVDGSDLEAAGDSLRYVNDPATLAARRENEMRGEAFRSPSVDSPPPGYVAKFSEGGVTYYQHPVTGQWVQVVSAAADTSTSGGQVRGGTNGGAASWDGGG